MAGEVVGMAAKYSKAADDVNCQERRVRGVRVI
jgi:hypothetical protein